MGSFAVFSGPNRWHIVALLGFGEPPAGVIAAQFLLSVRAISQHPKALREAELVRVGALGRFHRIPQPRQHAAAFDGELALAGPNLLRAALDADQRCQPAAPLAPWARSRTLHPGRTAIIYSMTSASTIIGSPSHPGGEPGSE